ncbi:MCP methyltransferase, CheR-type [Desulforamulus reducens MI-1]|uniref:MCP methyltransferase, CheR-type n=1 Tax=Desulforamulus reducens (strain ATCC BAA-1160 / DSM 100696 / MI-1) TaxID=349161 RepID=A4J3Z9_DESRM|nr:protein-glutamate O-methyltransferase CheR [Desulforamulus reducens]ABO49802.1 MCP methyltransferase, CheR-type [Desulforamulus reducens MI-1]
MERIEIQLLLQGIFQLYGYDFRDYVFSSIRRRIWHRVQAERLTTISALQERVFHQPDCMQRLLLDFSIQVTEMFRDPDFFKVFRERVVPCLREYPFIRIWHAGCSSGEEVYSMVILLYEEGLSDKSILYATDINEVALKTARAGAFPLEKMKTYTGNYLRAGGCQDFSQYYTAKDDYVVFRNFLKKNIVFAQHNLVTDSSFNEFDVIICRNVMIYFNKKLQNRVHGLFCQSLNYSGYLVLGKKEDIKFTAHAEHYKELYAEQRIYQKIR